MTIAEEAARFVADMNALAAPSAMPAKALLPIKAQTLDEDEEQAWWDGRVARRLLAIPFGGPIPSHKSAKGVDLDGEFFSERTDIYGPHRALRQNRERLVDFHHSARPPSPRYGDDTGLMRGHFLGKSILDPDPDEDGWWVDLWWERGNQRVALVKRLAERGAQLFGSSQPIGKAVINNNGEIAIWPFWLETISTTPQNTLSVIRPKAALDAVVGTPFWSDIEAQLRDLGSDLRLTSTGDDVAKAGRELSAANVKDIQEGLDAVRTALGRLDAMVKRQSKYTADAQSAEGEP
jgi:hypothetical protein